VNTPHRLSDNELLALARFIIAYASKSGSFHWRTRFSECERRGSFAPLAIRDDAMTLASLCARRGSAVVSGLRTAEVVSAANAISLARGAGPLGLPNGTGPYAVPTPEPGPSAVP
jgi:hypothetical protein